MPRVVSTKTEQEAAKTVTRPIYLVSFSYDPYIRFSSGPTLTWRGVQWDAKDLIVSIGADGRSGQVQIGNIDLAFGQKILADGLYGITIRVYQLLGSPPFANDDGERLYEGAGGQAAIDDRWVSIPLVGPHNAPQFFPFYRMDEANGFDYLPPDGTKISWGGEVFEFKRD